MLNRQTDICAGSQYCGCPGCVEEYDAWKKIPVAKRLELLNKVDTWDCSLTKRGARLGKIARALNRSFDVLIKREALQRTL